MTCNLNESQIQAWLDGDEDHSLHAAECSHCQQQLTLAHQVRSRLSPPPSPLGRDFAQRTAARVLRHTLVHDVVQRNRSERSAPWWKRVLDNPLVQILQRERTRRLLRAPGLAAVLLLYLVPGLFVMQGDAENQWAYFGILRMGLTWIVPLFLLTIEMTTLSGLVRGRCLEEMLQTGLEPRLVSDTLAANGLRSLLPVLLLSSLALLPLQPSLVASWLPITAVTFVGCCYLFQAYLLVSGPSRLLSALGGGCAVAALAAPAPYNLLALLALAGLAVWARQRSWQSLDQQQHGQTPTVQRSQPGKLQKWLALRLPDQALLQRELRRRPVLSVGMLLVNAGFLAGYVYLFGANGNHDIWPFFMAFPATVVGFSLLSREKESGGYEVLVHSGVRFCDWWVSTVWLAALQFAPILLTLSLLAAYQMRAEGLLVCGAMGLGVGCSLFVSLWAGSVIGASAGLTTDSPRQAALRCVRELLLVSALSLVLVGLSQPLLGSHSFLQGLLSSLGLTLDRFLNLADVLPVTLALYFRARLLREQENKPTIAFNPWLLGLAPALPAALWLQLYVEGESGLANWFGWVAVFVSLAWMWWVAPQAQTPSARKWLALTVSYLLTVGVGVRAILWMIGSNSSHWELLIGLQRFDWAQAILIAAPWAWLVALLGRRNRWSVSQDYPQREWLRRSLRMASIFSLGGILVAGQVARMGLGRSPSADLSAFVAKNHTMPKHNPVLGRTLKKFFGLSEYGPYLHSLSRMGSRRVQDQWSVSSFNRQALRQMGESPELVGSLVGQLQMHPGRSDAKEVRELFELCGIRLSQALFQKRSDTAMESLEWMAWLAHEAVQVGKATDSLAMCREIREQAILAMRSQLLSAAQLQRLGQRLSDLPDDTKGWQVQRNRQAALVYQMMLQCQDQDGWEQRVWATLQSFAGGRLFMKSQAEMFLNDYLSGKMAADKRPPSEWDTLARKSLWELSSGWNQAAENNQLLRTVGNQIWELERYRMEHGRYPDPWKTRGLKMRVAYSTDGAHYCLKVWGERDQPYPLIFSTTPSGFQVRR